MEQKWEEVRPVLDQPFYYLGRGAQVYAFVSEDNQYVMKFFRHHRSRQLLTHLLSFLPLSIKSAAQVSIQKRQAKLLKDFASYKIAYERLDEECGLIYLHLNKTDHLKKELHFFDKIGIHHTIPLDNVEFILQRRADPLYEKLERWIATGQLAEAKKGITNLVALLRLRCAKELSDKDPNLKTNFGFIDCKPIQFDVGRFKHDPSRSSPEIVHEELVRITDHLAHWLEKRKPILAQHLRQEVE